MHIEPFLPNLTFYENVSTLDLLKKRGILLHEETVYDLFNRVVNTLITVEDRFHTPKEEQEQLKRHVFQAIEKRYVAFGSPLLTNAGRGHVPTSSCTVIPVDLRKSLEEVKRIITPYFQAEMGSGFDLSDVQDPVSTLRELNRSLLEIEGHVKRPPCGMALLKVDHPKVLDFIRMKRNDDFSTWRFNLSVSVTDAFMEAVEKNQEWIFSDQTKERAGRIFDEIVESSHFCGEPGIVFIDNFTRDNPVPTLEYKSVAPCAEIAMAPGEVCQFSYVNLSEMVHKGPREELLFDFDALMNTSVLLTRLLDNGVEISIDNAVADGEVIASKRRISLGVCGFADLLLKLGIPYGSKRSLNLLGEIMSVINYHSKKVSVELAQSRGRFPSFGISRYLDRKWASRFSKYPTQHVSAVMWEKLASQIALHGIRNSGTTAIPPTGVSSRVIHSSQSIEPLFTLLDNQQHLRLDVKDALVKGMKRKHISELRQQEVFQSIEKKGFIPSSMSEIPLKLKRLFSVAGEVPWQKHLTILKRLSQYIDESVSKTVNFSHDTEVSVVRSCFLSAYHSHLKGLTVFRDGCLQERKNVFE